MRAVAAETLLPERLPEPVELVVVRSRRWLVETVDDDDLGSPVVAPACAEDDVQGEELSVFWEYEPDRQIVSSEGWERIGERGFDEPRTFDVHERAALGERDGDRLEPVPGAVPCGDQVRHLADGAVAQGAAAAAREPVHRRRHRPWQDDRGGTDRA